MLITERYLTNKYLVPLSFYPSSITGLLGWWDASQLSGEDGDAIANLPDLSDNSNSLSQSNESSRPKVVENGLNNLKTFFLDGTNDYFVLSTRLTNVRTAFVIAKYTGDNEGFDPIFGDSSSYSWHGDRSSKLLSGTYSSNYIRSGASFENGLSITPTSLYKPTTFKLLTFVTTGNVVVGNIAVDRNTSGSFWQGEYAEIILYSSALTSTERKNVETYLMEKWGLNV